MGFNNGIAQRKMKKQQQEERTICAEAGAPERVTEAVCGSLYDIYHNDRYYAENTISLEAVGDKIESFDTDPYEMIDDLLDQKESADEGIPWLTGFTCEELKGFLKGLSKEQLQLVELIGVKGLKQTEVAKITGKCQGTISKEWGNLCEKIRECLPKSVKNRFRY